MTAYLTVLTDNWKQGHFEDRDGTVYEVKGECDTARCGAVCCKVADWTGKVGVKCSKLTDDLFCEPHLEHGPATKPVSCLFWPLRPVDVETVNKLAERFDMPERCHLEVVEWQP